MRISDWSSDVCSSDLFAIDRAGLVGADGSTHAGSFDVTYLATLPNFVVIAAADEAELVHMTYTAAEYDDGPIAFRYPRGNGRSEEHTSELQSLIRISYAVFCLTTTNKTDQTRSNQIPTND